jgi:CYTH domain-containing protein
MTILRQFIVAPSLARLIQRERGGERVLEGYFPDRPHQSAYVQVEEHRSSLILLSGSSEEPIEHRADIPSAHAQALFAATAGQVNYIRTSLSIGSHRIELQHFVEPGPLDLVLVEWEDGEEYDLLPWLALEVTNDIAYQRRQMALGDLPAPPEVDLTNEALNSLLDILENGLASWPLRHLASAAEDLTTKQSIPPHPPEPTPMIDTDQDIDELGLEDDVIRDLARSLRPRRR